MSVIIASLSRALSSPPPNPVSTVCFLFLSYPPFFHSLPSSFSLSLSVSLCLPLSLSLSLLHRYLSLPLSLLAFSSPVSLSLPRSLSGLNAVSHFIAVGFNWPSPHLSSILFPFKLLWPVPVCLHSLCMVFFFLLQVYCIPPFSYQSMVSAASCSRNHNVPHSAEEWSCLGRAQSGFVLLIGFLMASEN